MPYLLSEHFEKRSSDFFSDYRGWQRWNVDRKQAQWIEPLPQSEPPLTLKLPPREDNQIWGVTGLVTRNRAMDQEGGFLIRAEFIPRRSGVTGEHFGIFLRVRNSTAPETAERFGVCIQNSRNPSGQCEGSEAFLQLTGRLKRSPETIYDHQCSCFPLKENVFSAGLNRRYRVEFEEKLKDSVLQWEGRVYRHGFWGWSLRGSHSIREPELQVRVPSLPAEIGVALGPGFEAKVDLISVQAQRPDREPT